MDWPTILGCTVMSYLGAWSAVHFHGTRALGRHVKRAERAADRAAADSESRHAPHAPHAPGHHHGGGGGMISGSMRGWNP